MILQREFWSPVDLQQADLHTANSSPAGGEISASAGRVRITHCQDGLRIASWGWSAAHLHHGAAGGHHGVGHQHPVFRGKGRRQLIQVPGCLHPVVTNAQHFDWSCRENVASPPEVLQVQAPDVIVG